jgi:hypothetical protein
VFGDSPKHAIEPFGCGNHRGANQVAPGWRVESHPFPLSRADTPAANQGDSALIRWTTERVDALRVEFGRHSTLTAACAASGVRLSNLQAICRPRGIDPRSWLAPATAAAATTVARERFDRQAAGAAVKALQRRIVQLEDESDFYAQLRPVAPIEVARSRPKSGKRPATPVTLASDWHIGEVVTAEETLGRNTYDLAEAKRRAANFWDNVLWLRDDWARTQTCDDHLLSLNGDMITGQIHPELTETNEVGMVDQVSECVGMIVPGVRALAAKSRRLIVTCVGGNHGRWTPKSQIKTGHQNNAEGLLYRWLRSECKDLENVEWIIPRAEGCALDVMGTRVQIQHGTQIKSQGGVGGILVPLTRWALRAASADLYLFGHFHQASWFESVIVNGSLIGDSGYSKWHGMTFRPPEQVGFVIDERRAVRHFERISVT